jgi:hypothetical protein
MPQVDLTLGSKVSNQNQPGYLVSEVDPFVKTTQRGSLATVSFAQAAA